MLIGLEKVLSEGNLNEEGWPEVKNAALNLASSC